MEKPIVCIDIGATRLRVGLGYRNGEIFNKVEFSTRLVIEENPTSKYVIADKLINVIESLLKRHNFSKNDLLGIGIGSIGPINLRSGIICKSPNLPYKQDYEIIKPLKEYFNTKVIMLNDCVAAVWGEKIFGIGKKYSNIVYVTFSTGIGGGVIVNNNLLLGKDGNAHEIGHVVVDTSENALICGCGGKGHWEAYCSGINIPKFIRKYIVERRLIHEFSQSLLGKLSKYDLNNITTEQFFKAINQGDSLSYRIFTEFSKFNAAGFATITHYYDPEIIIIGGAVALRNRSIFLKETLNYLDQFIMKGIRKPIITYTELGEDIVLKGALALIASTPKVMEEYFIESP